MATWEDGPEYAPVQRPVEYATAPVAPLEIAPPAVQLAAGAPLEQPRFENPVAPVAPLASLVPPVEHPRDPQIPFEVASTIMTEESSAWSAAHYAPPPPDAQGSGPWGPPAGTPWAQSPQPTAPLAPQAAPAPAYGQYAAPGTTQWFAPPPPGVAPAPPEPLTPGRLLNAASPGALICLLVGGLVFPLSPVTLAVAFGLSTRATAARSWVRRSYGIALGLLGFIGLIVLVGGFYDFSDWWLTVGRWGQLFSWILIVVVLVLVGRELRGRTGSQGPPPGTWG